MDRKIIETFEQFAEDINGIKEKEAKGFFTADKNTITVKSSANNIPLIFSFQERRSFTVSYHNQYNELKIVAILNVPTTLNVKIKVKKNPFIKFFSRSIEKKLSIEADNNIFARNLIRKSYFIDFILKYDFLTFKIESSEIILTASYLSTVHLSFLKDSHSFMTELTKNIS